MIPIRRKGLVIVISLGIVALLAGGLAAINLRAGYPDDSRAATGDVDWIIPDSDIEGYKARATSGDNRAAAALASHYAELRQYSEERRWLLMGAQRRDCNAVGLLKDRAQQFGHEAEARRWDEQLREFVCTTPNPNDPAHPIPLWD